MERNAILKLAESYDSFYLYEEAVILRNINRLKADFPGVSFLYSAKCNPYPKVLECVLAQGFGIDAASAAECVMVWSRIRFCIRHPEKRWRTSRLHFPLQR